MLRTWMEVGGVTVVCGVVHLQNTLGRLHWDMASFLDLNFSLPGFHVSETCHNFPVHDNSAGVNGIIQFELYYGFKLCIIKGLLL